MGTSFMKIAGSLNLTRAKESNLTGNMDTDKTTLEDLSIFNQEEFSVFNKLDFTITSNGKLRLQKILSTPLKTIREINGIQETLKLILQLEQQWPKQISNGSIKVVEAFFESTID